MTELHIATPDGIQKIYPEEQARALWQQGAIAEQSLYWKTGMTEWQPLRGYFAAPDGGSAAAAAVVPPPFNPQSAPGAFNAATGPHLFAFTKDPAGLTKFVKIMLWISLAIDVVSLLSDFGQLGLTKNLPITPEAAAANDARQRVIAVVYLLNFIVTGIFFLKWIYRANLNSHGFGAQDMQFSPGWSVGYYFVPFINLVRPYQAMKEIWQVGGNPRDWKVQSVSALLSWWWALWLISNIVAQVSASLAKEVKDVSSLVTATWASITHSTVHIAVCYVAISMIAAIYRKQKTLVEQGT